MTRSGSFAPLGLMALAMLSACASAPQHFDELERARAEVQNLEADPLAASNTGVNEQLKEARQALASADAAREKREPRERIVHLAYLAERQAQIGEARAKELRLHEQVAQAEEKRGQALLQARTAEIEAAHAAAARKSAEAEQAKSELERINQELAELRAAQTERGMVLNIGSDLLFDTGKAELKPGAAAQLDRVAEFLRENPRMRILIEGHTDSRGSEAFNQQLSEDRASAVRDALLVRNVGREQLGIQGAGESAPVATNDTVAGRQQNRRVEIVFSEPGGRFAEGAAEPPPRMR